MPVNDINAVEMIEDFSKVFESTETTSNFWSLNPELISWVFILIFILFVGILGFLLVTKIAPKLLKG